MCKLFFLDIMSLKYDSYVENEIAILTSFFKKKLIGMRKVIVYFLWGKSYRLLCL